MLPVDVLLVSTNLLRDDNDIVFYSGKSVQACCTFETYYYQEPADSSVNCIRSLFRMHLVIDIITKFMATYS